MLLFQSGGNETSLFNMKEEILRKTCPKSNEAESKGWGEREVLTCNKRGYESFVV
jgi:hypothetical protein